MENEPEKKKPRRKKRPSDVFLADSLPARYVVRTRNATIQEIVAPSPSAAIQAHLGGVAKRLGTHEKVEHGARRLGWL